MTIIVHGATGAQGAPVASALASTGHDITAAVRNPQTYTAGKAVRVDLDNATSLTSAYQAATGVFVHLPLGSPEQQLTWAKTIALAVTTAKPGRVVISTSGYQLQDPDDDSPIGVLVRALAEADISTAVIMPRLYLENLLLPPVTEPIQAEGVLRYPIRADYAVSWSSHLDIADVAVRLFDHPTVTGTVEVGALPGLTGADLAHGFAEHYGHDVRFEPQTPDEMGAAIEPLFGAEGVVPVVESYRWRQTQPDDLIAEQTSAQHRLGITPRTVAQWLKDINA